MSSSVIDQQVLATQVEVTDLTLQVSLSDGRTITVPLSWFPRLVYGTASERGNIKLIGQGSGIHWPELDEDISVNNLLQGQRSTESHSSLKKWLIQRKATPYSFPLDV